jgi:hypothetical protein
MARREYASIGSAPSLERSESAPMPFYMAGDTLIFST